MLIEYKKKKKRKLKFWMEDNQDAAGYQFGDNRAWNSFIPPESSRKEVVRRSWNF